jgi:uncharacterized membrane protein YhaH (DUF805 family)
MLRYAFWFYLTPIGRTNRKEFWLYLFGPIAVVSFLWGFFVVVNLHLSDTHGATPFVIVTIVLALCTWIGLVVTIKRLHDFNASGGWALLAFLPYVGVLVPIVVGLIPGTPGENRFGLGIGPPARSNQSLERP